MTDEVILYLGKAEHALKVTEKLADEGFASDAASKIYYAMFYAAQALLKAEGIDVIKHSAVESALGYHFAKTGKMDARFHRMFIEARKIREIADYDILEDVAEPVTTVKIEEGREFLGEVKRLLGQ
jgi:uncharacterized protein (UPF0332 family)